MVVHDSMKGVNELRGVKVGQVWRGRCIKHITIAGEAIFEDNSWEYVDRINGTNDDL